MGIFVFHNMYSETDDISMNKSDSKQVDFNIELNTFNTNLLKLKQELNKLSSEKA